jgi:chromate reductase, NAD(P)H dehydrogenase (quinone)
MLVMGGEAYITFKPELLDGNDNVTDASTRTFLKNFLDQLAALTAKLTAKRAPRAAA